MVCYPLKDSNTYNFVFIRCTCLNNLSEMRLYFKDWYPRLTMVLEIAQDVQQRPLKASLGKERWVHAAGDLVG